MLLDLAADRSDVLAGHAAQESAVRFGEALDVVRRIEVEFQESRVTSDGGRILVRELDKRLGLSDLIAQQATDPRGKNT